jgi:hypothetical protein
MSSLKTCQILVFNLALHGAGSQKLWRILMQIYEKRFMKASRNDSYHIFSLIGFMMRDSFVTNHPDD